MLWGMVQFSHIPSAQFSRILPVRSPKVLRYIYTLRQERLDCMIMHTGWDSVDCWKTKPTNALLKEINNDRNGVLYKDEIEAAYLADEKNTRQLEILLMCLHSANSSFWSNFIWFLGSIAYLVPVYMTDSLTATWEYRVSVVVLMPLSQETHGASSSASKCNSQWSY